MVGAEGVGVGVGVAEAVGGGATEVVGATAEVVVTGAAEVVVAAIAVVVDAALWCGLWWVFFLAAFFLWGVVVVGVDAADVLERELELPELPQPASATAAAIEISSARFMIGLPLSLEDFGPEYKTFR